jgi:hypothetical protein
MNKKQMNRIWIELERPKDAAHAELIAKLANNVLRKIGIATRAFFWDEKDQIWCFGNDMGYTTLGDNGEWFNLDYLGKD